MRRNGYKEENSAEDLGRSGDSRTSLRGRRWLAYLNFPDFRWRWLTKPNLPD